MAEAEKESGKQEIEKTPSRSLSPFEEMDRMFERFFPSGWIQPFRWEMPSWGRLHMPFGGKFPGVDVIDRDTDVVIKAEVPGVKKEDLEITMTDNTVTIKGMTSHEEKEEKGDYFRQEISRGAFTRTVALPSEVDADQATTRFTDGILEITVPKVAKAKRRTIKVE